MDEITGLIEDLEDIEASLANSESADAATFNPKPATTLFTLPSQPAADLAGILSKIAAVEARIDAAKLENQQRLTDAATLRVVELALARTQADSAAPNNKAAH